MENNINVTNDTNEFKKKSIALAVDEVCLNKNVSDVDKQKLCDIYLNDKRNVKEIFEEIKRLTKEEIENKLNLNNEKLPQENKITLDNVDEFENESKTKRYIKIHYPYPTDEIKIVENHSGKTAKELFEAAKDENGLVSVNGFVNSVDVYENSIEKQRIEIKVKNVTDLAKRGEFSKLSYKEKQCVYGLISSIINMLAKSEEDKKRLMQTPVDQVILRLSKNVFVAPDENIVILCVPNDPTKDEISAVVKNQDQEYQLRNLKINEDVINYDGISSNKQEDEIGYNGSQLRKKAPWEKKKAS